VYGGGARKDVVSVRQSHWFVLAVGLALSLIGLSGPTVFAQQRPVTVTLAEQNSSGLSGTATLTDMGNGQTNVVIQLNSTAGDHPAHIHMGSCPTPDATPEYPLNNVQNGTSTTVVDVALSTLLSSQRAINVHLSPEEISTYVACGNLPLEGTQPPNAPGPAGGATGTGGVAVGGAGAAQTPRGAPAQAPSQVPAALPNTGDLGEVGSLASSAGLGLLALGLALRWGSKRRH